MPSYFTNGVGESSSPWKNWSSDSCVPALTPAKRSSTCQSQSLVRFHSDVLVQRFSCATYMSRTTTITSYVMSPMSSTTASPFFQPTTAFKLPSLC